MYENQLFSKPLGMVFLGGKLGIPRYLFVRQTKLSQIVPSFLIDLFFNAFNFAIFRFIFLEFFKTLYSASKKNDVIQYRWPVIGQ